MPEKTRSSKCGDPDVFMSISDIVRGIYGDSAPVKLQATRRIRRLLSGTNLIFRISSIVEAGVIPRLVEFLTYDHSPELQFESAWALTNIASGTSADTHAVVTAGAIPVLIKCMSSSENNVKAQAVWALGNIAGDGPTLRDEVIQAGVVTPLIEVIDSTSFPTSSLRTAVWGLATMCYNKRPPPPFEEVKPFIPTLAKLLYHPDKQVLNESCWAVSYLADGGDNQIEEVVKVSSIVPRLVQLLKHDDLTVTEAALRAIGNIVTGTDPQTQVVINCGALPTLGELLDHPDVRVQKDAAWALSNVLAGTPDQIQAVLDNNLIELIIRKLDKSQYMVQKELVWSLTNLMSGGTVKQISYVLHQGLIPILLKFLSMEQAHEVYAAVMKISGKKSNSKAAGANTIDKPSLWKKIENATCELLKRGEECLRSILKADRHPIRQI